MPSICSQSWRRDWGEAEKPLSAVNNKVGAQVFEATFFDGLGKSKGEPPNLLAVS